ncbi:MAG: hypothetical protein ACPGUD_08020 [Parashewanella sp.]
MLTNYDITYHCNYSCQVNEVYKVVVEDPEQQLRTEEESALVEQINQKQKISDLPDRIKAIEQIMATTTVSLSSKSKIEICQLQLQNYLALRDRLYEMTDSDETVTFALFCNNRALICAKAVVDLYSPYVAQEAFETCRSLYLDFLKIADQLCQEQQQIVLFDYINQFTQQQIRIFTDSPQPNIVVGTSSLKFSRDQVYDLIKADFNHGKKEALLCRITMLESVLEKTITDAEAEAALQIYLSEKYFEYTLLLDKSKCPPSMDCINTISCRGLQLLLNSKTTKRLKNVDTYFNAAHHRWLGYLTSQCYNSNELELIDVAVNLVNQVEDVAHQLDLITDCLTVQRPKKYPVQGKRKFNDSNVSVSKVTKHKADSRSVSGKSGELRQAIRRKWNPAPSDLA